MSKIMYVDTYHCNRMETAMDGDGQGELQFHPCRLKFSYKNVLSKPTVVGRELRGLGINLREDEGPRSNSM